MAGSPGAGRVRVNTDRLQQRLRRPQPAHLRVPLYEDTYAWRHAYDEVITTQIFLSKPNGVGVINCYTFVWVFLTKHAKFDSARLLSIATAS